MSHRIRRLGHLGDGIADGPVYVARALPGELVDGAVEAGRIAKPRILDPSPDRVKAPCPHYGGCGGCAVMHASDDFVAGWKADSVRQALAAHGLEADITEVITSPPESRRRATFSGRRLKSGAVVGFHAKGAETVRAVPDCQVVTPGLKAAFAALEEATAWLASRKGEVRFAVTEAETGLDVDISGAPAQGGADLLELSALAERHDLARLSVDAEVVVERRPPSHRFGEADVVPPPGAFLQATCEGQNALTEAVLTALAGCARVVDLFAGCGTFALPLARRATVHAVEGDAGMLSALDRGWRHGTGLKAVTTEARDLFRRPLLSEELGRFDGAVIDPPRAGAEAQMQEIARSRLAVLAAVSCNPTTFARDAATLIRAGFAMGPITVVDQFRWSPHVELVTTFTR
ncbi:MAG: class I SAM-dependent RNA methyltransferase [Pseudomonadota bacterium]